MATFNGTSLASLYLSYFLGSFALLRIVVVVVVLVVAVAVAVVVNS